MAIWRRRAFCHLLHFKSILWIYFWRSGEFYFFRIKKLWNWKQVTANETKYVSQIFVCVICVNEQFFIDASNIRYIDIKRDLADSRSGFERKESRECEACDVNLPRLYPSQRVRGRREWQPPGRWWTNPSGNGRLSLLDGTPPHRCCWRTSCENLWWYPRWKWRRLKN